MVPVVISVGIVPDDYVTEYTVVSDTGNTTALVGLVNSIFLQRIFNSEQKYGLNYFFQFLILSLLSSPCSCFINKDSVLYTVFFIPILLILIFNIGIFLLAVQKTVHHRLCSSRLKDSKKRFKAKEVVMAFISLVGINFLLGITWLFLFFYLIFDTGTIATVLWIFSVFLISLQGFFIFFFFVVLNADARKAWKKFLCACKNKAKPITSTNNKHVVRRSNGGDLGTLSSALPSYQSATLEQSTEKCSKQTLEVLPFKKPFASKEVGKESSPDVIGPPLECIHMKISLKEEQEDVKEDDKKGTIILMRVRRQSSEKVSHGVEIVELDFGLSSAESLNEEDP